MTISALGGDFTMWPSFLHTPKNEDISPLQFDQKENIPEHSVERKIY